MIYEFKCSKHGKSELVESPHPEQSIWATCPTTGEPELFTRYYGSVQTQRPMPRHFNQSVGKEIGSMRQFRDELKRKGDAEYARTGIETDYQPLDPEIARKQVERSEAQGLDATNRKRTEQGQKTIDL